MRGARGSRRAPSSATSASSSEEAIVSAGVKVYPFKTIEAGAVVNAERHLGVARPAHACSARAASPAWSTSRSPPSSPSGWPAPTPPRCRRARPSSTSPGRVPGRPRAQAGGRSRALNASAINVLDLEVAPAAGGPARRPPRAAAPAASCSAPRPGTRRASTSSSSTSSGADLAQAAQRKLERVFARGRSSAGPSPARSATCPSRRGSIEAYTHELLRRVDMTGVRGAGLKVVVDSAGGTASLVLPTLLGRARRRRAHRQQPPGRGVARPRRAAERAEACSGSVELVAPPGRPSACGSTRSASGSRWWTRRGELIDDERALLVVLDLVAAERQGGTVALPVTTTRVAEQVAASTASTSRWTATAPAALTAAAPPTGRGLRRRRPRRLRRARVLHDVRRHRGVRAAARPGRPDPAAR